MKPWQLAAVSAAGVALTASAGSAYHPHLQQHFHHKQPGVVLVPVAPAVQSFSVVQPAQSFALIPSAQTFAVPQALTFSAPAQSFALPSAQTYSFSVVPGQAALGQSAADSQAVGGLLLQQFLSGLLRGALDDRLGTRPSGDLETRLRQLEGRVDALEKAKPATKGEKKDPKPGPGIKKGQPDTGGNEAVDSQGAGAKPPASNSLEKALQALELSEEASFQAQVAATNALRVLKRQQDYNADAIRRLEGYLKPPSAPDQKPVAPDQKPVAPPG